MAKKQKTGFDTYFGQRMSDPTFAAEYREARAKIDATEKLLRALDAARERAGMTKADLARRINTKPETIRRLLSAADGNPTMGTVLKIAAALGCRLELVADTRPASGRGLAVKAQASRQSR